MSSVPDVFIIISCRNEKYTTQFAVGVIDILIAVVVAAFFEATHESTFRTKYPRSVLSFFLPFLPTRNMNIIDIIDFLILMNIFQSFYI